MNFKFDWEKEETVQSTEKFQFDWEKTQPTEKVVTEQEPIPYSPEEQFGRILGTVKGKPIPERPFMEEYPTLYGVGKAIETLPQGIKEFGEEVVAGVTLGLSKQATKLGEYLSEKITGRPVPTKEKVLPEYMKTIGEFAGAAVPIGAAGKIIAEPLIKVASKSKYLEPFARMIGWGAAGTAYDTASKMASEGELPSPEEMAKSGGLWAGIEAILATTGWGGRLAIGVNNLAKTWGIPRQEVLKTVLAEARARKMPIARYAYAKAKVQKALGGKVPKAAEQLVTTLESLHQGTYPQLVEQLRNEELTSKVKMFKDYAGKGIELGKEIKPPTGLIRERAPEVRKAFEKPGFMRTAEERLILREKPEPGLMPEPTPEGPIETIPGFRPRPPEIKEVPPPVFDIRAPRVEPPISPKALPPGQGFILRSVERPKFEPRGEGVGTPMPPGATEEGGITLGFGPAGELQKLYEKARRGFKNSVDAIEFGVRNKGKGEITNILREGEKVFGIQAVRALEKKDFQTAVDLGVKSQLYREAAEAAEGKLTHEGYVKGYKAPKLKPVPDSVTLGFGPASELQKLYEKLIAKPKTTELPKYARSINIQRQKISQPYKEFEVELAKILPKKAVQTWDRTGELSNNILKDYKKAASVLTKAKEGKALTAVEIDAARQINVNAISRLKEIAEESPEQFAEHLSNYKNDIFMAVSNASSEAGRALNIHKKEISVNRLADAFVKLERGLNERELKEFKALNFENPLEIKRFMERLGDPKLRDYFYEFWYNSILSGIPTHLINIASNTAWAAFQFPHRALTASIDSLISKFSGRKQEIFIDEIIPMWAGLKKGFGKGLAGAAEMIRTGKVREFETKWEREIGGTTLGAFERSPYKALRQLSPFVTMPTRALRAMDVWANTMAFDTQIEALIHRMGKQKGLTGTELKNFEQRYLTNPNLIPQEIIEDAGKFAKYNTFMDDLGKFTEWIRRGRDVIPGGRLISPFVNTISNLVKRGVEMIPGAGLLISRGKPIAETLAKQIEGSILSLYIMHKANLGEITGAAPKSTTEREAFYREGKLPWAIRIGDKWYQYRRIEPFNTVIASNAVAYDAIKNAKDDETRTEIFMNTVDGVIENLIDSSYLQGVTNILDKYGRRRGMGQRMLASFVPYSSFFRSIVRSYEAATEDTAKVRETQSLLGAFSQVIPGLNDKVPPKLDIWGKEITLPGGVLRQWLPYKWSKEGEDAVDKEFGKLGIYPGHPQRKIRIGKNQIELSDTMYRNYCISFGSKAHRVMSRIIHNKKYQSQNDEMKLKILNNVMSKIRNIELYRVKKQYILEKRIKR